jgi:hypothetical protein
MKRCRVSRQRFLFIMSHINIHHVCLDTNALGEATYPVNTASLYQRSSIRVFRMRSLSASEAG